MFIIFEGHDLSGKTSIAQGLSKRLNHCIYLKNSHTPMGHIKTEEEALKNSYTLIHAYYKSMEAYLPKSHLIVDRYFLSELVYSEVLRGHSSKSDRFYTRLKHKIDSIESLLVLVTCSDKDIEARAESRGEDFVDVDQIKKAKDLYLDLFYDWGPSHKIQINNNAGELEKNISDLNKIIK